MGNDSMVQKTADSELPREFENAQDANGIYAQDADTGGIWRL